MKNKVVVSRKVLALLGEDTERELDLLNGCIYRTEDRHYLHRMLGKINGTLMRYVTKRSLSQKELQEIISDQIAAPLVALGFLEYVTESTPKFNLNIVVDSYGELIRVLVDGDFGKQVYDTSVICKEKSLQENIYRIIGMYMQGEFLARYSK